MLVLTRKLNEQIDVGPDVVITVIRIGDNNVRIGIDAPPGTRILRGELVADETKEEGRRQNHAN